MCLLFTVFTLIPTTNVYAVAPAATNISIDGLPLIPGSNIVLQITTVGDPETVTATIWDATHTLTHIGMGIWEVTIPVPDPLPTGDIAIGEITLTRGGIVVTRDFTAATMDILATRVTPAVIVPGGQINIEVDAVGNPDNIIAIVNGQTFSLVPGQGLLWSVNAHIPFNAPGGVHTIQIRATLGQTVIERTITHTVEAITAVRVTPHEVIAGGTQHVEADILSAPASVYVLLNGTQHPLTHISGTLWRGPVALPLGLTAGAHAGTLITRTGLFVEQQAVSFSVLGELTITNPFVSQVGTMLRTVTISANSSWAHAMTATIGANTWPLHNTWSNPTHYSTTIHSFGLPAGEHTVRFTATRDGVTVHRDITIVSMGITSARITSPVIGLGGTIQAEVTVTGAPDSVRIFYDGWWQYFTSVGGGIWRRDLTVHNDTWPRHTNIEARTGGMAHSTSVLTITPTQIFPVVSVAPTGTLLHGQTITIQADMTVPVDTVHAQLGSNNVLLTHIGSNRWQGTFTIPSSNFAGSHQIFFVARTGEVIVGTRQFPVSVAPIISTVSVTPTGILTPTQEIAVVTDLTVPVDTVHARLGTAEFLLTHVGNNRWQGPATIPSTGFMGAQQVVIVARTGGVILETRAHNVTVVTVWGPTVSPNPVQTGSVLTVTVRAVPNAASVVMPFNGTERSFIRGADDLWSFTYTIPQTYLHQTHATNIIARDSAGVELGRATVSIQVTRPVPFPIPITPNGFAPGETVPVRFFTQFAAEASSSVAPPVPSSLTVSFGEFSRTISPVWDHGPWVWISPSIHVPFVGWVASHQTAQNVPVTIPANTPAGSFAGTVTATHGTSVVTRAIPNIIVHSLGWGHVTNAPVPPGRLARVQVTARSHAVHARWNGQNFPLTHTPTPAEPDLWTGTIPIPAGLADSWQSAQMVSTTAGHVLTTNFSFIVEVITSAHIWPNPVHIGNMFNVSANVTPDATAVRLNLFGVEHNLVRTSGNQWSTSFTVPLTAPQGINTGTLTVLDGTTVLGTRSISTEVRHPLHSFTMVLSRVNGVTHAQLQAWREGAAPLPSSVTATILGQTISMSATQQWVPARTWWCEHNGYVHIPGHYVAGPFSGTLVLPEIVPAGLTNGTLQMVLNGTTAILPFSVNIHGLVEPIAINSPVLSGQALQVQATAISSAVHARWNNQNFPLTHTPTTANPHLWIGTIPIPTGQTDGWQDAWMTSITAGQQLTQHFQFLVGVFEDVSLFHVWQHIQTGAHVPLTARTTPTATRVTFSIGTYLAELVRGANNTWSTTFVVPQTLHHGPHPITWRAFDSAGNLLGTRTGHMIVNRPELRFVSAPWSIAPGTVVKISASHVHTTLAPTSVTATFFGHTVTMQQTLQDVWVWSPHQSRMIVSHSVRHYTADILVPANAPAGTAHGTITARNGPSATVYPFSSYVHSFSAASITNPSLVMPGTILNVQATARASAVSATFSRLHPGYYDEWVEVIGQSVPLTNTGGDLWAGTVPIPATQPNGHYTLRVTSPVGWSNVTRDIHIEVRDMRVTFVQEVTSAFLGDSISIRTTVTGLPATVHVRLAGVEYPLALSGADWAGSIRLPATLTGSTHVAQIVVRRGTEVVERNFNVPVRTIVAVRTTPTHPHRVPAGAWLELETDVLGAPAGVTMTVAGTTVPLVHIGGTLWRGIADIPSTLTAGMHTGQVRAQHGAEFETRNFTFESTDWAGAVAQGFTVQVRAVLVIHVANPFVFAGEQLTLSTDIAGNPDSVSALVGGVEFPLTRVGTTSEWCGTALVGNALIDGTTHTGEIIVRRGSFRTASIPENRFNFTVQCTIVAARPIYAQEATTIISGNYQVSTVMSGDYLIVEADLAKVTETTSVFVTFDNGVTEHRLDRIGNTMTWRGTGIVPTGLTDGVHTGRVIVRHLGIERTHSFNYTVYGTLFQEVILRFR